jgi:hypothetical protein
MDYKTKKGNIYQLNVNTPRRLCKGVRMVLADNPRNKMLVSGTTNNKTVQYQTETVEILSTLAVYGTTDVLAKRGGHTLGLSKQITVEHPTDKGYFKKVFVLSDYGKRLIKNKSYNL